jgi:hypothetical protein
MNLQIREIARRRLHLRVHPQGVGHDSSSKGFWYVWFMMPKLALIFCCLSYLMEDALAKILASQSPSALLPLASPPGGARGTQIALPGSPRVSPPLPLASAGPVVAPPAAKGGWGSLFSRWMAIPWGRRRPGMGMPSRRTRVTVVVVADDWRLRRGGERGG